MWDVTIVIPNYNGISCLGACLRSVSAQEHIRAQVLVVDNGSTDGSREFIRRHFPTCGLIALERNYGFCRAVNEGIKKADSPYVILLNNDTQARPDFARKLLDAIRGDKRRFSCAAKMLQYDKRDRLDSAGDFYCALGWGIARGKGKPASRYGKGGEIFSSCAGAAIYRRKLVEELGGFDEAHFAYLEDLDLSYRAKIYGYHHWYAPEAEVFHLGSATSGSRYNPFKVTHSAGNNVYLIYKNMPFLQIALNAPRLLAGFLIKYLFFVKKGMGREYRKGLRRGVSLCRGNRSRKVRFCVGHIPNYMKIQLELWKNILLFVGWA